MTRPNLHDAAAARDARPVAVPHRLRRTDDPDITDVMTLDGARRLGYVVRNELPSGSSAWLAHDVDGRPAREFARTRADAGMLVARSEPARRVAAEHERRKVTVHVQGGLPSCKRWYVRGAGVLGLPVDERPSSFRTRRDAREWAESAGLLVVAR